MKLSLKDFTCALFLSCTVITPCSGAHAQPSKVSIDTLAGNRSVTVVPGAEYEAGALHQLIFGSHWRSLWTTPVEVQVLDLKTFGGGLTPLEKGGGFQTLTLSFRGADGKEYRFRTLDKDPARGMPSKLRNTIVSDVVQDQVSASNPVSALVASPLLDAAEVYHVTPQIIVLPYDKELLGRHYDEFAGLVGTIEERPEESSLPGAGFRGADKISGTYKVFDTLEEDSGNRIDARSYLRARLIDLFIGDWDRHSDQWRWAGYKKDGLITWAPIPRDRDNAFSRQDGVFSWIITQIIPQIEGFGDAYPDIRYLSWSGRPLDRRILSGMGRSEWNAVAVGLQQKLTDAVIREAVGKMPQAMYAKEGPRLEKELLARRDLLVRAALELYMVYAEDVDVFASSKPELALVHRLQDGQVEVSVFQKAGSSKEPSGTPVFRRLFNPRETSEIRLYLRSGDDDVLVDGAVGKDGVKVRVIGGEGADRFEDRSEKPASGYPWTGEKATFFYDDGEHSEFSGTRYTVIDRYKVTPEPQEDKEKYDLRPRDSGQEVVANITGLRADYSPDYGPYLGWGVTVEDYGFRSEPFRYNMQLSGGVAAGEDLRYQLHYRGDFRTLFRNASLLLEAGTSGLDMINFYGLGNENYYRGSGFRETDFEVMNRVTTLRASLRYPMDRKYHWSAGVSAKWVDLEIDPGSLMDVNRASIPGIDDDFAGGFHAGFHYDSRESGERVGLSPRKQAGRLAAGEEQGGTSALSGFVADIEGSHYPRFFGNEEAFTRVRGEIRSYIPLSSSGYSRLVLRLGGEKIWGDYPFWEAAFIGGATSLRGYDRQRFAGDASLYAGSELRLYFGKFKFLVPVIYGPVVFAETGRVFLDGEDSSVWHTSAGSGLWLGFIQSRYSASIVYARGFDDCRLIDDYGVYLRTGFSF